MNPEGQDFYKPGGGATAVADQPPTPAPSAGTPSQPPPADNSGLTWTATEYTHHDRGASWYAMLAGGTILLAAAVYFLTKDYFATGTIAVVGIIVGVFAARKPGQMTYELSDAGLRVGQKLYRYGQFKSFAIIRTNEASSISLLPLKKLMPPVEAFFGAADEEKMVDIIGRHLPYEERKQTGIDRLSHRLKF